MKPTLAIIRWFVTANSEFEKVMNDEIALAIEMSYIEENLMNGENILYRARLHWVVFVWPLIWFIVAIIFFGRGGHAAFTAGCLFILISIAKAISSFIRFSSM